MTSTKRFSQRFTLKVSDQDESVLTWWPYELRSNSGFISFIAMDLEKGH